MRTLLYWFNGQNGPAAGRTLRGLGVLVAMVILLPVTLAAGYVAGRAHRAAADKSASSSLPDGARMLRAGPWGELEMVPVTIAAPPERLPVRAVEASATRWRFSDYSRNDFVRLVDSLGVSEADRAQWLSAEVLHEQPDGSRVDVTPTHALSLGLSAAARLRVVTELSRTTDNMGQLWYFHTTLLPDYLRKADVSRETRDLVDRYTVTYGEYRVIADLPALLSAIPAYEERARLIRGLTAQRSLLMRLNVHADTNVPALLSYWGKGLWATDAEALLSSLKQVKHGAWVDVVELLPPRISGMLYTFPVPENPMSGPVVHRDCHWTSFNFFRDTPDPECANPAHFTELLRDQYVPVIDDPRYGDVILFTRADGVAVHSCVYIADDVVFTKNGDTSIHPWMFATLEDVKKQYGCWVRPGERLGVSYYRGKM